MRSLRSAYFVLLLLSIAALAQNVWYWQELADPVATHFDITGQPDAWMSKKAAVSLMVLLQLGMPVFMVAVVGLSRRLPMSMVNIPHREYWLHEDRRTQSLDYVQTTMSWMAVAMSGFLMMINHLTYVANRDHQSLQLTVFLVALGAFLAFVFSLVGRMVWHFRFPRSKATGGAI